MCLEQRARREGKTAWELVYDTMLEREGRELIYRPANYNRHYSLDSLRELLLDPINMISLADGGAHCAASCDAGGPTALPLGARPRTQRADPAGNGGQAPDS